MTFLKVMAFSVAVLLAYTLFANILPQVQSDPPAEEEPVAAGSLDAAGMVAWGEKLFAGKGTCTLCHNDRGRAPDILAMDLKTTFTERLATSLSALPCCVNMAPFASSRSLRSIPLLRGRAPTSRAMSASLKATLASSD